jgi:hypothetical protein
VKPVADVGVRRGGVGVSSTASTTTGLSGVARRSLSGRCVLMASAGQWHCGSVDGRPGKGLRVDLHPGNGLAEDGKGSFRSMRKRLSL